MWKSLAGAANYGFIPRTLADDVEYRAFSDLQSLPAHRLELVRRFFMDYKILENKEVEVNEFAGLHEAHAIIRGAIERYQERFGPA